jgi:hypothetical protein
MMNKISKMMKMIIKFNIGATKKTKLSDSCHCLLHGTFIFVSSEQLDGGMNSFLLCNVF